jgi:beta-galactosidase
LSLCPFSLSAAPESDLPQIGAQVFIEPGQTARDIEDWFRILQENGMTVCRIRMFETHMHRADGTWDFALYDEAFRAAERHGVRVFATLFPADATVGGFKYPRSEAHLAEVAVYIQALAAHFKAFPALYGWVLQNDRHRRQLYGQRPRPVCAKHGKARARNGRPAEVQRDLFRQRGVSALLPTWYLNWLRTSFAPSTPAAPAVNNHAIFSNFPSTTSGVARVPHHARRLRASELALRHLPPRTVRTRALATTTSSVSGGAPALLAHRTQGGNNLYSGGKPICPTKEKRPSGSGHAGMRRERRDLLVAQSARRHRRARDGRSSRSSANLPTVSPRARRDPTLADHAALFANASRPIRRHAPARARGVLDGQKTAARRP